MFCRWLGLSFVALGLMSGCFDSEPGSDEALVMHPVALTVAGDLVPLEDGDDVPLFLTGNGTYALRVGAAVSNLFSDEMGLEAIIRDDEGHVLVHTRQTVLMTQTGSVAEPDLTDVRNGLAELDLCRHEQNVLIEGRALALELHVVKGSEDLVSFLTVTPRCDASDLACRCACVDFLPDVTCP